MKKKILLILLTSLVLSCSSPEKKLMNSIQSGNLIEVERLLKTGVDPNVILDNGLTPLTQAIEKSKSKIVTKLIDFDADINLKDNFGYTPFTKSVSIGNDKIISILLDAKCEVKMQDSLTQTVFLDIKNTELLAKLKENNVNYDIPSNNGATLAMKAAESQNFELLKFLINDKVKRIYIKDSLGKTVFDYAQKKDNDSILTFLKEVKRVDKIWPKIGSIVYFPKHRLRYYSGDPWREIIRSIVTKISGNKYEVKALDHVQFRPSNNNRYWLERKYIFSTRAKVKKSGIAAYR